MALLRPSDFESDYMKRKIDEVLAKEARARNRKSIFQNGIKQRSYPAVVRGVSKRIIRWRD